MSADTVKLYAATLTAVVMALGGCLLLVYVAMQPAIEGKDGLMALLGGFIGFAIQFLFGQETATRATRAAQSSAAQATGMDASDVARRIGQTP